MQYYGAFYRTELHSLLKRINAYLMRWIRRKYKRLAGFKKSQEVLGGHHNPLSADVRSLALDSCVLVIRATKSPVTGDCHAGFCGGVRREVARCE
jgi:hypothetical protein